MLSGLMSSALLAIVDSYGISDNATSVEIEELLGELDLMRNMTPHENILNLLGQCTTPGMY